MIDPTLEVEAAAKDYAEKLATLKTRCVVLSILIHVFLSRQKYMIDYMKTA